MFRRAAEEAWRLAGEGMLDSITGVEALSPSQAFWFFF